MLVICHQEISFAVIAATPWLPRRVIVLIRKWIHIRDGFTSAIFVPNQRFLIILRGKPPDHPLEKKLTIFLSKKLKVFTEKPEIALSVMLLRHQFYAVGNS